MLREECAEHSVVKLSAIVSLGSQNWSPKLCLNKGMEVLRNGHGIGLASQWERPEIVRVIIEHDKIVL